MTQSIIPEANPDPTTVINVDPTKPMKVIDMNEIKNNVDNNDAFKQFLATGSSVIQTCRDLMHVTEIQKDEILRLREENERLRKEVEGRKEINDALARYGISASGLDAGSVLDGKLTLLDTIENLMDEHQIENADDLVFVLENYDKFKDVASDLGCIQNCDADELRGKVEDLKKNNSSVPSDYQTLKDFKEEMDAIHDEFGIPHDVDALRKDLQMAKSIKEAIEELTDIDIGNEHAVANIREALEEYHDMKEACDNHGVEYADLDSTLEEKDQYDNVLGDYNITDASDLDDTLTDMEDAKAYEKGFNELAEFVEKIKEVIGHCGDDIPATDMEDYK